MSGSFEPISLKPGAVPRADWEWVPLSAVARLESGHTPSRRVPEYWEGGTIPWLSLKDIRRRVGMYVYETADQPTQLGIDNSSARVLPAGTVALCRTASVGKVAVLGRAMATSQDFVNWVCGPRLLPEYLYHALMCSSRFFDAQKEGSTHKTIYFPTVQKFHVLLPPLPEQKRIAAILDKADEIRRKRQEAIRLTEELLRSAFLEMFGDPVTNPKGWEVRRLGDLSALIDYGVTASATADPVGPKFLRITDIQDDRVSWSTVPYCAPSPKDAARAELRSGDIVFARTGATTGKSFLVDEPPANAVFASYLIRVRASAEIGPAYLAEFFKTDAYWGQIRQMSKGAAQPGVNGSSLAALQVPVPSRAAQEQFTRFRCKNTEAAKCSLLAAEHHGALARTLAMRAFAGTI